MRPTVLALLAVLTAAVLAGCGGEAATPPPATVTVTAPPSTAPPTGAPVGTPPRQVEIPDVVGQNGAIALDTLTEAGFTKVQTATQDTADRFVVNAANWTVTEVAPDAGTSVRTDRTVVVTMTKEE